ncbi:MAG: hypothetical protein NWE94_02185 [Candidatus Bathyarchaeota archaeon]|nr:hypothetical protein [Candidatus Bathyarchaeota archaeon]
MVDKTQIAPFIITAHDSKENPSYPAELASIVCLAEFQRRKTGFLRDTPEKVAFLSKLYYPMWIAPFEDSCLVIDGLASVTHNFSFKEPANIEFFVEDLKKHKAVPREFMTVVNRQTKNAGKLASTVNISFNALVANKELLKFLAENLRRSSTTNSDKLVLIPMAIDEAAAAAAYETVANCLRRIHASVKGLRYALEILNESVEYHECMTLNEVELLREKCEAEVAVLKTEVKKTIEQLKLKRDAAVAHEMKNAEKKVASLEKKREKWMHKLQELEHRKTYTQKKRSSTYMLEKYDREIDSIKKEIHMLSSMIEQVKKEENRNTKKIDDEFRVNAASEEEKIKKLSSEYEAKISEKKKQIAATSSEAQAIAKNFTSLMEEMKRAASVFREQTTINWKLDDRTLICIPIYIAEYTKDNEERYSLFSPVTLSEDISVLQELRKILTHPSEPRLKLLMRPASNELHEMLNSAIIRKIQNEKTFRQNIISICRANNLLEREDFKRVLNEGLAEIEQRQWLTAEETATVRKGIIGEET